MKERAKNARYDVFMNVALSTIKTALSCSFVSKSVGQGGEMLRQCYQFNRKASHTSQEESGSTY